ncbi:MAG TPA: cupin domain-containing protein [Candidatus Elarobacter sp.]|jgi:quercetin dioxygenase-like cupin family protein|nr:cupin domain-containing protein [Candidatus Elarobacter sp.]
MADGAAPWGEYGVWLQGETTGSYYADLLGDATAKPQRDAARKKILKAAELPWENAPHGLLKHIVNESMGTRAETVDAYMQIIPPGSRSGRHRQLAEQAFYVLEGRGYDVHVDCDLDLPGGERYVWVPQREEKRFEWEAGDVVYVPPNTISQHFNADPERPARIVVITNRIYKQCGLNDLEQLENAPEYDPNERLTAERLRRYLEVPAGARSHSL